MAKKKTRKSKGSNAKTEDLSLNTEKGQEEFLTTNHGLCINDDQNSLKEGELKGKVHSKVISGSHESFTDVFYRKSA